MLQASAACSQVCLAQKQGPTKLLWSGAYDVCCLDGVQVHICCVACQLPARELEVLPKSVLPVLPALLCGLGTLSIGTTVAELHKDCMLTDLDQCQAGRKVQCFEATLGWLKPIPLQMPQIEPQHAQLHDYRLASSCGRADHLQARSQQLVGRSNS